MVCGGPDKNCPLIYRMTLVNMSKQKKQGYTGYTETLKLTWVHRIYRGIKSIQYYQGKRVHKIYRGIQCIQYDQSKHGYTGYIGVYKVYSMTRVNMGKQDIQGYTRYTVLLG